MFATFKETSGFTDWVTTQIDDNEYAKLQLLLMVQPDAGDVIPGCGGLRKYRWTNAKNRKGKRGGYRVLYLYLPESHLFVLIDGYSKTEKDDLNTEEKRYIRELVTQIKSHNRKDRL